MKLDLINQIADRAELDYRDILEDIYIKVCNYQERVLMYRMSCLHYIS